MNTTRHGGVDDTGEQDVSRLRRDLADGKLAASWLTEFPFVRHREDVPHEGALPDLYGREDDDEDLPSIDEIKTELSEMVDNGELCMGWDEEEQAFVYWVPQSTPERPSHRAPRPRRKRTMSQALVTVIASMAPLCGGVAIAASAYNAHHQAAQHVTDPADVSDNAPAPQHTPAPAPLGTSRPLVEQAQKPPRARHAKEKGPDEGKSKPYVGKHRKGAPKAAHTPAKKAAGQDSGRDTGAVGAPAPSPSPTKQTTSVVGGLVHAVLEPVGSILG